MNSIQTSELPNRSLLLVDCRPC